MDSLKLDRLDRVFTARMIFAIRRQALLFRLQGAVFRVYPKRNREKGP